MSLIYTFIFLFICGIPQSRADDETTLVIFFKDGSNETFGLNCESIKGILKYLNSDNRICLFAPGFNFDLDGPAVTIMKQAHLDNNCTYILLNWYKAAQPLPWELCFIAYTRVVANALQIGCKLGEVLACLMPEAEIDLLPRIQLIGHSLGAHIMGEAGKKYTKVTGQLIPHVVALDAAGVGFEGTTLGVTPVSGGKVDVFHTTCKSGGLGIQEARGTTDIYAVCGEDKQCGCEKTNTLSSALDCNKVFDCNHFRAVSLYNVSLYEPRNTNNRIFVATLATSTAIWLQNGGDSTKRAYIQPEPNMGAPGKYYLCCSRAVAPYGSGINGSQPTSGTCPCSCCEASP